MTNLSIKIKWMGSFDKLATYDVRVSDNITHILKTFAESLKLHFSELVFIFNGLRICDGSPENRGMEDGDVVEASLGVCRDYSSLLNDTATWNVKMTCRGGEVVNANKTILSDDGYELVNLSNEFGIIDLSEYDVSAVKILVRILFLRNMYYDHSHSVTSNPALVLQILKMAMRFKLPWLVEKTFKFLCLTSKSLSEDQKQHLARNSKERLATDFGELLESGEMSDFKIICGGEEFPCHKAILLARSKVWRAMINNDMRESNEGQLIISDMEPALVQIILRFIYTGEVVFEDKTIATKLLEVADKLEIKGLRNLCEDFLIYTLGNSNVLDLLVAADLYHAHVLKEFAIKWVVANRTDIVKKEGWKEVLIKFPNLLVEIFDAVSTK